EAAAADHERAPPATLAGRRDGVLFLDRQAAADQREDELLAERWRESVLDGRGACALDDVPLLTQVARRHPERPLDRAALLRGRLAPGDEREDLAVDLAELGAEGVEAGAGIVGHPPTLLSARVLHHHRRPVDRHHARAVLLLDPAALAAQP